MKKKKIFLFAVILLCALGYTGCDKDEPSISPNPPVDYPTSPPVDTRLDCEKNNTGTLKFENISSNPYRIYVNDILIGSIYSKSEKSFTHLAGYCKIEVVQESGYLLYPTKQSFTGTLTTCGSLRTVFPQGFTFNN